MTNKTIHYQYPVEDFDLSRVKEGDLLALSKSWAANKLVLEVNHEESRLVSLSRANSYRDIMDEIIPYISESTHILERGNEFFWTPGITTFSSPCSVGYEEKNKCLEEAKL